MLNKIKTFFQVHGVEIANAVITGVIVLGGVLLVVGTIKAVIDANKPGEKLYSVTLHNTIDGTDEHLVVTERLLHEMEEHQAAAEAGKEPLPWA